MIYMLYCKCVIPYILYFFIYFQYDQSRQSRQIEQTKMWRVFFQNESRQPHLQPPSSDPDLSLELAADVQYLNEVENIRDYY